MKKSKNSINKFIAPQNIEKLIDKWRKILGIDPVYVIQYIESPEDTGYPAWIDGLNINNTHPMANIFINSNWLHKNKHDKYKIITIIVHELLHILAMEAFMVIDPNYKYEGLKARANEILTMKLTTAIMSLYQDLQ